MMSVLSSNMSVGLSNLAGFGEIFPRFYAYVRHHLFRPTNRLCLHLEYMDCIVS